MQGDLQGVSLLGLLAINAAADSLPDSGRKYAALSQVVCGHVPMMRTAVPDDRSACAPSAALKQDLHQLNVATAELASDSEIATAHRHAAWLWSCVRCGVG